MSSVESNFHLISFKTSDSLATSLANRIYSLLNETVKENGKANFLVSGGNTPKLFFEKLSFYGLDWEKVNIGLVDERCVDKKSKDSNENLVNKFLLSNSAKNANFISLYKNSDLYKDIFSNIDVLVLGMGNDGHTASIFPELDNLNEALTSKKFLITTKPKNAPFDRISLTLNSILNAKNIFIHIEGKEKYRVFNEALEDENRYPISKVLFNNKKTVEVYCNE